jgi:hypothetical protein
MQTEQEEIKARTFEALECVVQLEDKEAATRVATAFKQHAGIVVPQTRDTSTHAVVECFQPAIGDAHPQIMQVTWQWVEASIDAGELQDECDYEPARATRKRKLVPSSPEQKKKTKQDDYEIQYFYSKQAAKDHYSKKYGPDAFYFKLGNTEFAAMPSRQALIDHCLQIYKEDGSLPPFYEVVQGEYCRLYLDIEMESEEEQTPAVMSGIIFKVLDIVRRKLAELNGAESEQFQETIVATNHRWKERDVDKKQLWNLSAHAILPKVLFEHNDRGMKSFLQKVVDKELEKDDALVWLKRCKAKLEPRTAVDQRTYAHEQAFRLVFTSKKDDKDHLLLPYDLEEERPVSPKSLEDVQKVLSLSLVSRADRTDCVRITDRQVSEFLGEQPPPAQLARPEASQSLPHLSATKAEQKFVADQILPNLDKRRYSETSLWLKIGYGTHSVFGGNKLGLDLFKKWSATASNYNPQMCEEVYYRSNDTIGFGSFAAWLKEDEPDLGLLLMNKFKREQGQNDDDDDDDDDTVDTKPTLNNKVDPRV